MATRSAVFLQTDTGDWLRHYCHYDGYPDHMLPALAKADPAAIRAARELRQILADGTVDGFPQPRSPERMATPDWPEWAEHAYLLTGTGWRHTATPAALAEAARD
jgi:hypothetical protein